MSTKNTTESHMQVRNPRPAYTMEEREDRLINAAYDLAEKRILEGTASPSEVVHFLRLGTRRGRSEQSLIESKQHLVDAQVESIKSQKNTEELYANAVKAFGAYRGNTPDEEDLFENVNVQQL
mgnify:FL=1